MKSALFPHIFIVICCTALTGSSMSMFFQTEEWHWLIACLVNLIAAGLNVTIILDLVYGDE